ncbi:MAG: hypothetical protein EA401_13645 [Planctomycetota bacterium]|nr:MAG: hypothetical protein EA401_13645 [Planctomycetota bacterium]
MIGGCFLEQPQSIWRPQGDSKLTLGKELPLRGACFKPRKCPIWGFSAGRSGDQCLGGKLYAALLAVTEPFKASPGSIKLPCSQHINTLIGLAFSIAECWLRS